MSNTKSEMSFRHKWVLAVGQDHRVSEGARLLGIVSINQFGKPDEGAEFWPSHKALADLLGVTERTAARRMDELVRNGFINKRSGGGRASNRYVATLPSTDSDDGTSVSSIGEVVVAEAPCTDTGDGIEIRSTDTGDGGAPTVVSGEQVYQQIHEEHVQPSGIPCFVCFERESECICTQPGEAETAPIMKPCGCLAFETCADCSGRFKVISNLPRAKQEELHEKHNVEEGWDEYAHPEQSGPVTRFKSRARV